MHVIADVDPRTTYDEFMRWFLVFFGLALFACGCGIYFVLAKSAIHEIEGAIVALGGITAFVGGAIVGAIEERR